MESKGMCERCGLNEAQESHECPYQAEINDNEDPAYCTCCVDCEADCRDSI